MTWTRFAAIAALGAMATVALPQNLFSAGRTVRDQGISLKSWGSGTIAESDEAAFGGTTSIRISGRNFFQGGILTFANPVSMGTAFADKNNLLSVMLFLPEMVGGGMMGPGGMPGIPGRPGLGAPGLGGPPGGVMPPGGGRPGAGGPPWGGGPPPGVAGPGMGGAGMGGAAMGAAGMGGMGGFGQAQAPSIRRVRFVVTTTDGKRSEGYMDVVGRPADDRGWRRLSIPLQAVRGFENTNKQIASIAFSADATSTFFIGEVGLINDTTPISGDVNVRELNLGLGDEVQLIATGFGGASVIRYEWDFDTQGQFETDAEGQVVRRRFRSPGEFLITVRFSDMYGLKAPFETTIRVTVNP